MVVPQSGRSKDVMATPNPTKDKEQFRDQFQSYIEVPWNQKTKMRVGINETVQTH